MANVLKDVIEKQKMYSTIQGNKYITVGGWNTLGTMLGVTPREESVHEIEDGWYAKVDLINRAGMVIGGASAICTRDEKSWKARDGFALRSMAITRATGKAYRLAFSWIVNMAGYAETPAEEMPFEPAVAKKATKKKQEIFSKDNQEHLDRLDKFLEQREVPAEYHLAIAEHMNGKVISKEIIEIAIREHVK